MELTAVAAVVPVYGRGPHLVRAVTSLLESRGVEMRVVLVDTTPEAGALPIPTVASRRITLVESRGRAGFARAINEGVRASRSAFVMFGNDDLVVAPTYVWELMQAMRRHRQAAIVGGKILRSATGTGTTAATIDSAGIVLRRSRRAENRGEGTIDAGQFDRESQVFGLSGAGLLARREALDDVTAGNGPLDETFFMYKEDVDLAWRLRLLGWECWYVPRATAYHARTSRSHPGGFLSDPRRLMRLEREKPEHVRVHSMKNQWLLLTKNELRNNVIRDAPWIVARETVVLLHNALFAPRTLRAIPLFLKALPAALASRRYVMARRQTDAAELRRWSRPAATHVSTHLRRERRRRGSYPAGEGRP